ncbi:MAG: signal peptidase II [Methyloligellaceae bacterium]
MRIFHIIFIAFIMFILDQLSKWAVLYHLDLLSTGRQEIIPGYVNFILAWNRGINFGLLASNSTYALIILIVFPIVVSIGLLWWNVKSSRYYLGLGSAFIIGGALANALDRVIYGAVVDFLNVTAFGIRNPYSFNIADVAIFLGAAIIILDIQFDTEKK